MNKNYKLVILNLLIILCVLFTSFNIKVKCYENNINSEANSYAISLIDNILNYKMNESSCNTVQEFIDNTLTSNAGISSEWYIIGLSQYDDYDFSKYEKSLINYVNSNDIFSSTSQIKYALCLSAIGSTNRYITSVLNSSIGKQGIMSYIYGLHLLNNNYQSEAYTKDELINILLSSQCSDGGWSLTGEKGDVDVTAMVVQSLSIYYNEYENVKEGIDKALAFLSDKQLIDGDYMSYGTCNVESTVQVLVALSSLNIDCISDQRFIKNGNTLFDGIKKYQLSNFTFSHILNNEFNENATVQVFYGMIAYLRMHNKQSPLYIFDKCDYQNVEKNVVGKVDDTINDVINNISIKHYIIISIIVISLIICITLLILKNKNIKNYLFIIAITLLLITILLCLNISTPNDYYGEDVKKDNPIGVVSIEIRCDTIIDKDNKDYIPKNGIILSVDQWEIEENETVYDILIQVAKKYAIQVDKEGVNSNIYISGINYIYELQYGSLSGWMCYVNGESIPISCGAYIVYPSDHIEWLYTCDMGNDLK